MAELRAARDRVTGADLIELRLDTVHDPSIAGALEGRRQPVIVTCRAAWEGGQFRGSEEERHRLLRDALASDAEYVDIEWRARFDDLLASSNGRRVVLSSHDFDGVPDDLLARARAMRATGAEVVKIAVKASRLSDCLPLLPIASDRDMTGRVVLIAMGEAGLATRILAGRFGSAWTYAGSVKDVGQLDAKTLVEGYRFRGIGEHTHLYGLVGSPVAHSVSPAMHNAAFAAAGLDAVYLPLPAADADDFVTFARAMGLRGASVTIPYKVALFERVDEMDDVASHVGAINTVRVSDGRWEGRNTDLAGFLQPLDAADIPLRGTRASILGAGGSARSVALALSSRGATVTVHARDARRAENVATLVSGRTGEWPPAAGSWDLLVNCTPIGMHPYTENTPLPKAALDGRVVYDLIYNPARTRLLDDAAAAGCQTIGGLDMLVGQAVEQFQWWTGRRPEVTVMRAAALTRLSEFMDR
jgi:3-dehydroquinate dehydratase/shikimate dehydrogenase